MFSDLPDGWVQFTHPEGQPYFIHPQPEFVCMTLLQGFTRVSNIYYRESSQKHGQQIKNSMNLWLISSILSMISSEEKTLPSKMLILSFIAHWTMTGQPGVDIILCFIKVESYSGWKTSPSMIIFKKSKVNSIQLTSVSVHVACLFILDALTLMLVFFKCCSELFLESQYWYNQVLLQ